MSTYYLIMDLTFSSDDPSRDTDREFDHFTDKMLDELIALEATDAGVSLPDISATLSHRKLSVAMCVEADSYRDAARLFSANVRTALHAAGCRTSGWPAPSQLPEPQQLDCADA